MLFEQIFNILKTFISATVEEKNSFERSIIGDMETAMFTSTGGELYSFIHKLRIVVPPNAVPTGKRAVLNVTGCCYGSFLLPPNCKPCSDFMFVKLEGIDSFKQPVLVEISHNLMISGNEHQLHHHNIVICHCSTHKTPSNSPLVFTKIAKPHVSDNDSTVSFYLTNFCGLCAAYEADTAYPFLKPSTFETGKCKPWPYLPHDFPSTHETKQLPFSHNHSLGESEMLTKENLLINEQPDFNHLHLGLGVPKYSLKRKFHQSDVEWYNTVNKTKRVCQPEYTMLCYWQLALLPGALSFVMFVCKNCPTSIAVSCCKTAYIIFKLQSY